MAWKVGSRPSLAALLLALAALAPCRAANAVRRLVVLKVDGLGQENLDRYLNARDPQTGKSELPWIHRIFVENGAVVRNFYVRGISLSVPSWSMLDTGRPAVIRGNAEFDRYTGRVYDYMNFFPFYFKNARNLTADMPAVEVLDQAGIPLLIDSFAPSEALQSMQLFQRGVRWRTLKSTLPRRFGRGVRTLFNEWQTGFEVSEAVGEQVEHELIAALANDRVLYLDYFFGDWDHIAHLANDETSQRQTLRNLDRLAGHIWTAIERSPLADETALVLVSDHGINSDPAVYSQGFSLVNFFASAAGGAHHVLTNRHPESEFKLKGLDPFVDEVVTASRESFYLRGQADDYPTAQLDLDGNERAAVYLRNSDINALHLMLKQPDRASVTGRIVELVDRHRRQWTRAESELTAELAALDRAVRRNRRSLPAEPPADRAPWKRVRAQIDIWERRHRRYSAHLDWLRAVLRLTADRIAPGKAKTATLVPKRAVLDPNSIYDLQNYDAGGPERIDYPRVLANLRVRNNVQRDVGSHPIDFIAIPAPLEALRTALDVSEMPDADGVWLYAGEDRQALILSREGGALLRYLPVRKLRQDSDGRIAFERQPPAPGLPLRYFEDGVLLDGWRTETEWFRATHQARYANGIIALAQHFAPIAPGGSSLLNAGSGEDAPVLLRFERRLRETVQPDMVIFANDHWNFNVRGFNPGGNHGSFLRVSMHSTLMFAGAAIPRGLAIEQPYDSLSLVPTLLELTGRAPRAPYPGRVVRELFGR